MKKTIWEKSEKDARKLCFSDLTPEDVGYALIKHYQALHAKIDDLQKENAKLNAKIKETAKEKSAEKNRRGTWLFVDYSAGITAKCSRCGTLSSGDDYIPFPKYCMGCGLQMTRGSKIKKLLESK